MPRWILISFTLLASLAWMLPARAVDFFWEPSVIGGPSGNFRTSQNWTFTPPPFPLEPAPGGANDTVNFDLGRAPENRYTVTNVHGENNRLVVHDDSLTLVVPDVNIGVATDYVLSNDSTTSPSLTIGVALGDVADVILAGDGGRAVVDMQAATIGLAPLSTGTLTVDNFLRLRGAGELVVGESGTGTLTIQNEAVVASAGGLLGINEGPGYRASGTVLVTGTGSTWNIDEELNVGGEGTGTLTVEAGGSLNSGDGNIGVDSGANGQVTVTGEGSTWASSGSLRIGFADEGSLTIEDGGAVSNIGGFIGVNPDSSGTVLVTGADSVWTNSFVLTVGRLGRGTLIIENGGSVISDGGNIGYFDPAATGEVTVRGPGSNWTNTGSLSVGSVGDATMTIADGGNVANTAGIIGFTDDSTGAATVTGAGSTWTNSEDLTVGDSGVGHLLLDDGGAVSNANGRIAVNQDSTGEVNVRGANSNWTCVGELEVGIAGAGTMTIEDGGEVVNFTDGSIGVAAESTGLVTVRGAGSRWANGDFVRVGDEGNGTLSILNGGVVSNGAGRVAAQPGSTGMVTVSSIGSTWTNNGSLVVGEEGDGELMIEAGGSVSSEPDSSDVFTAGLVGWQTGSTGTVTLTGAGSTWVNDGDLGVGIRGSGTLMVQNGAAVAVARHSGLGSRTGSSGMATIMGAGSTWTVSENLFVGGDLGVTGGAGTLSILDGGAVTSGAGFIANISGSSGTVTVDSQGSTWSIGGDLTVGNVGTATLRIRNGGAVTVGSGGAGDLTGNANSQVTLDSDAVLDVRGTMDMNGGAFHFLGGTLHVDIYNGDLTNAGGTLAPGRSPGSTTILGDYTQQAGATLEIEIGGTATATQFDFVDVNGTATLGGELQLAIINGFMPDATEEFVVFNADEDLLSFFVNAGNGQRIDTVDGLGSFLVQYGPTSPFNANQIVLSEFVPAVLPGDYNNDGAVDAADYVVWRTNEGTNNPLPNDLIGGSIGDAHYDQWRANFGSTLASGSVGTESAVQASVPETESTVMLLSALVLLMMTPRENMLGSAQTRPSALPVY